jgi:hypothetical protein
MSDVDFYDLCKSGDRDVEVLVLGFLEVSFKRSKSRILIPWLTCLE